MTGLKARTNAGRPNWNKVFTKIRDQKVGKVPSPHISLILPPLLPFLSIYHLVSQITVFFCGNPTLAKMLKKKCDEFGFTFRKEVF